MKLENPCSPGHCLGMLNANMRTDLLQQVHQGIFARMEHRGKQSPLAILIESIEEVLTACAGHTLPPSVGPNPFHTEPFRRFDREPDYHHDVKLLQSQLRALHKLLASLAHL